MSPEAEYSAHKSLSHSGGQCKTAAALVPRARAMQLLKVGKIRSRIGCVTVLLLHLLAILCDGRDMSIVKM